jgi:hypothetical protein
MALSREFTCDSGNKLTIKNGVMTVNLKASLTSGTDYKNLTLSQAMGRTKL